MIFSKLKWIDFYSKHWFFCPKTFKNEIFQGDTCSWTGQLERKKSWKVLSLNVRNEIGKIEVGKFGPKSESLSWNWKARTEIGKFKLNCSKTFQLQKKLSNFARFFPTLLGSFQLQSVLSNFYWLFPTSAKLSNLKLSNFSFFPTALSNYTYPKKSPKKQNYHQVLRIFVWILFPEMTLGDAPKRNFSKFSWILFPRFANMG